VHMIREHTERVQGDAVTLGRERKDVEKRLVRQAGRPEQELPLGASPGDEVRSARNDVARGGHGRGVGTRRAARKLADALDSDSIDGPSPVRFG